MKSYFHVYPLYKWEQLCRETYYISLVTGLADKLSLIVQDRSGKQSKVSFE